MTDGITKREILSSAMEYITGLATKQDLDRLKAAVYAKDEGIETAARTWRVGTSHFVTAFKLEQKRMENINSMLALQGQSIHELQASNTFVITLSGHSNFAHRPLLT